VKCVNCGADSDYKARQAGGRCRECGRQFAFEPRRDRGMTDRTFKLALEAVSDGGRLAWTEDHLYYDVCRRVRRRRPMHRLLRRPMVSLDRSRFELLLGRWVDAHGPLVGRLEPMVFAEVSPDPLAPRVEAYGFEQLVICDSDAIADVLLVNGSHAELKCPVLSQSGYPAHVYEPLIQLLRERPPATVVVIHDADWNGCRLAGAIADDPRWFAGVELPNVIDAGLRPGDAPRYRGLFQRASAGFDAMSQGTTPAEAKWLSRYRLELTAARPRVLMGVLGRVLRGESEAAGSTDGAGPLWLGDTWADGDDEVG
jgi:DNA-directed RNA polymerase subunit RPC12/RpoP